MSIRTGVMPIAAQDHTSACGVSILGSTGYGFDAAGRLQTVTDGTNAATYSYLANSRLIGQIAYARSGQTVMIRTNQYDALNRLVKTETQDAQPAVLASFAYGLNAAHQRTSVTNADGAYWVYQYDSLGQVTSGRKCWANGTPVLGQQFDYTFDDIGNRQTAVTGGDAAGHNRRYQHYTANSRNQYEERLVPGYLEVTGSAATNATVTLNNQAVTRQGEYFWGKLGLNNSTGSVWLSLTNLGVLAVSTNSDVAVTNTGQLFLPQTPEAFAHDADGNLTNDGRWNDTWDAENRLVRMVSRTDTPTNSWRSLTFGYDPQGRRISKTVSNWVGSAWQLVSDERFAFDGWNCLAVLNSSFSLLHSFTWGLDLSGTMQGAGGVGGLLWLDDPVHTNVTQFVAFDGNGNVAALVSSTNGAVTANYEYGPFGEVIRATGPMAKANPFQFSTKYQDEESDLLYYGYRYYNGSSGRWLSRDPIGELGGRNLYAFDRSDPILSYDAHGLICDKCKRGNIRYVEFAGYSLMAHGLGLSPSSVDAGYSALNGVEVIHFISEFAEVSEGLAAEEVAKDVAKASATLGISKGMRWNWTEAMIEKIDEIEKNIQRQYGVDLWINIRWQKCELTYLFPSHPTQVIPFTKHLDWVPKSDWYMSDDGNRPEGGFEVGDHLGILEALPASIIAAIQALVQ